MQSHHKAVKRKSNFASYTPFLTEFSIKLKKLRAEKGLTQSGLSEKAGISHSQIGKYETGAIHPSSEMIKKMADAPGINIDYFFSEMEKSEEPSIKIEDIDILYKELRNSITGDTGEMDAIKRVFEAMIFKNNARKRFR